MTSIVVEYSGEELKRVIRNSYCELSIRLSMMMQLKGEISLNVFIIKILIKKSNANIEIG